MWIKVVHIYYNTWLYNKILYWIERPDIVLFVACICCPDENNSSQAEILVGPHHSHDNPSDPYYSEIKREQKTIDMDQNPSYEHVVIDQNPSYGKRECTCMDNNYYLHASFQFQNSKY